MRAARSAAGVSAVMIVASIVVVHGGGTSRAGPPADAGDVLLTDVAGFALTDETPGADGSVSRRLEGDAGLLQLQATPVTNPPGVRTMFQVFTGPDGPMEPVPEDSLDLAVWLVFAGTEVGDDGTALLAFAGRDHIFTFAFVARGETDAPAFVLDLARSQLARAGEPPPEDTDRNSEGDRAVAAMLPVEPPAGYDLTLSATAIGGDEISTGGGVVPAVTDFLNRNSSTAARVWADSTGELAGAISITRYPYDIFAAASLGAADAHDAEIQSTDALDDVDDVLLSTVTDDDAGQITTVFRRGDVVVVVSTTRRGSVPDSRAAALAADLTRLAAASVPPGDSEPYDFPSTPSTLASLALTAGFVSAMAGGSMLVARVRARAVRRRWAGSALPPPSAAGAGAAGTAIALDGDAARLRHNGAMVRIGQIGVVNVSIVALAGDFAPRGYVIAGLALIAGLLMTRWWQRRELGLLGARAPARELVLPRPAGAMAGVLSLAVLGLGVGFAFKGLRYLFFPITLAQLKWADRFSVAPHTVGVIFAVGGFVVASVGGWLFRSARALSRAGARRALAADPRPAALWLRSFDDDSLPLPAITSARRPLFELFSLRGADSFEESVAWELGTYGPVVAVGRPGRSLASLGAAREHLSDSTWRDQVAARMEQAGIIAVATGETDGLAWELGQIVKGGHLDKTFFVFPPVAPDALGRRWDHTTSALARAGVDVGPLPVPPSLVHTVRVVAGGGTTVTFASRRDEATYRTAVDRALDRDAPGVEPALARPALTGGAA